MCDYANEIKFFGFIFLLSVFWGGALVNLLNWNIGEKYIQSNGFQSNSSFILLLGIFWQILGGTLLIIPSTARLGCILLILFCVLSSLKFHQFWKKNGIEGYTNLINFLSNMGVVGGLLLLLSQLGPLTFPLNFHFIKSVY